jgi:hypothetical protein
VTQARSFYRRALGERSSPSATGIDVLVQAVAGLAAAEPLRSGRISAGQYDRHESRIITHRRGQLAGIGGLHTR